MGFLRFIFAISVLVFHANGGFANNAAVTKLAVPSFFIISGFYISLIVKKKYIGKNSSYWVYFSNRLLRIYPLYWAVLLLMVVFSLFKYITHIGGVDNALLRALGSGTSMIDYVLRNVTLVITNNLWKAVDPTIGYLVGPQVWALQPEILFYIGAPFILKQRLRIGGVFMIVTVVVVHFLSAPLKMMMEGSIFFVFISSLKYFFLGIVSYFIYVSQKKVKESPLPFSLIIIFIGAIFVTAANNSVIEVVYYLSLTASIPFIFTTFAQNRWDRVLGSMSYPIFISHIFFIKLASQLVQAKNPLSLTVTSLVITIIGSYVLLRFIDEPINNFRQRRLRR